MFYVSIICYLPNNCFGYESNSNVLRSYSSVVLNCFHLHAWLGGEKGFRIVAAYNHQGVVSPVVYIAVQYISILDVNGNVAYIFIAIEQNADLIKQRSVELNTFQKTNASSL